MDSEQIRDFHLLYNAVYDEDLREQFDEYNNTIYDEDIVEVATEYFYAYGLNEDGIDILIEKVGLDSFVEYVYELSEDLHVLTEERSAKKAKPGAKTVEQVRADIDAKEKKAAAKKAAKKNVTAAATEKKEVERQEPETRGPESEAKAQQPKGKKPIKDRIAKAILDGIDRHNKATETAGRRSAEVVKGGIERHNKAAKNVERRAAGVRGLPEFGKGLMHGFGTTVGVIGRAAGLKEEVELWVNNLLEEGYDLSEYSWDDMFEIYESVKDPEKLLESSGMTPENKEYWDQLVKKYGPNPYSNPQRRIDLDRELGRKDSTPEESPKEKKGKPTTDMRNVAVHEDLYDVILSHLLDEGYAESVEQAEVIMVNMSEDWRESIIGG